MTQIGESVAVALAPSSKDEKKDFEVEWSREFVIPDNILKTGDIEAKFNLKSVQGSLGSDAIVSIAGTNKGRRLATDSVLEFKVSGSKLTASDGKDATIRFRIEHGIWRDYNKLEYDFGC